MSTRRIIIFRHVIFYESVPIFGSIIGGFHAVFT